MLECNKWLNRLSGIFLNEENYCFIHSVNNYDLIKNFILEIFYKYFCNSSHAPPAATSKLFIHVIATITSPKTPSFPKPREGHKIVILSLSQRQQARDPNLISIDAHVRARVEIDREPRDNNSPGQANTPRGICSRRRPIEFA